MPSGISPLHISDGVLSAPVLGAGWAITGILLIFTLRKVKMEDIPKIGILTAFFFVASLIHIDIGPSSAHLILNGLEGAILGIFAYPAIFVGLLLQALLFAHGGITVLGVNAVNMGIPALAAYGILRFIAGRERKPGGGEFLERMRKGGFGYGALAGIFGVGLGVCLASLSMYATSSKYAGVIATLGLWHLPIMGAEAVVVGAALAFICRIRPDILPGGLR